MICGCFCCFEAAVRLFQCFISFANLAPCDLFLWVVGLREVLGFVKCFCPSLPASMYLVRSFPLFCIWWSEYNNYSELPLVQPPLWDPVKVSWLEGWPHFQGLILHLELFGQQGHVCCAKQWVIFCCFCFVDVSGGEFGVWVERMLSVER